MKIEKKSKFFAPLTAWKYAFKKPVTVPMEDIFDKPRVGPKNSRGYHVNNQEQCIGCGTCSEICPTEAIKMIPTPGLVDEQGSKPERPTIDYGRCCFCALCVDICTTGSLNMTREYLHNSASPDDFYLMPTDESINGEETGFGYEKTDESDLLDLDRAEMVLEEADIRKDSFIEIIRGYSKEQAKIEASRCVGCEICTKRCPAHMNIPEYIDAIWRDDIEEGLELLYKTNPLAGVCGSICTHKCEGVCSIGQRGEPIAIRWLKRYIVDNAPDEMYDKVVVAPVSKAGEGKVAIVGAGPAGISASYYLRTLGYDVDLYEKTSQIGGVARYGGPNYRLPEERLNKDTDVLKKIGVNIHVNTRIGEDITMDALKESHDVVFLSAGMPDSRPLNIPGMDHEDIGYAMKLLKQTKDFQRGEDERPHVKESIVVIGGGNVAFDVGRTVLRHQNEVFGHSDTHMVSLETRDILPADLEEIEEGEEEGLKYHFGNGPVEVVIEDGKIAGLKVKKCLSVFDDEGRFSPSFDEDAVEVIPATQVFVAIGQMADHVYVQGEIEDKIELVRGKFQVNDDCQVDGVPWLFAGGDVIKGPDIVNAVADGHRAAVGIDKYLQEQ